MRKNVVLVLLLVMAAPLHADDAENAAVKRIENLAGGVGRDDKDPAHPVISVHFFTNQIRDRRGPEGTGPLQETTDTGPL